ncbi:nucleotidyl transferase AbiEii/AbiGii toxin family protein [Mycoplasma anatis]|uniref:Nucleotidyl transferase AbiEii/AbiGii toxin family protein n=1 Tax=Mycoplasmopsis anatis TaxID=171279 RepID=A0A9Q3L9K5_9BACT|nr:nucleotidyl transferase AbiEii/AbiGii toxin family protein [Mycoplasmopsis anatis]
MNKNKLRAICLKVATKSGLNYNSVLVYFFLESILYKISKSIYKKNFIFKGGFLLYNVIGISQRTTYDIDTLVKSFNLTKEQIIKAFNLILQTESDEDIKY